MTTARLTNVYEKGFTLVELLIVITILGVLATVLLVSINPLEQIGRGRDAGRLSATAQLGHLMSSYFTAQNLAQYPAAATTWQNNLIGSGELSNAVIINQTNTTTCLAADNQGGMCYVPDTTTSTNDTALIWTPLESTAQKAIYKTKNANVACTGYLVVLYNSALAKAGLACLTNATTAPTATTTIL